MRWLPRPGTDQDVDGHGPLRCWPWTCTPWPPT